MPAKFIPLRLQGMTLVEVVASLALLGTLLVSLVMAKTQHQRQWQLAEQKQQAAVAADRLLSEWWRNLDTLPRTAVGTIDDMWQWRTEVRDDEVLADLNVQILRLELRDLKQSTTSGPLLSVELIVPGPTQANPLPDAQ